MRRKISDWEGCKLLAYQDPVGIWTVGVGHTGTFAGKPVGPGMRISEAEADALLTQDLERFEKAVESLCPVTSQAQFDALVSLAFNIGEGALGRSTLRRLHNEGRFAEAGIEFSKWNKAGGRALAGLTRRRAGERRVYSLGEYNA